MLSATKLPNNYFLFFDRLNKRLNLKSIFLIKDSISIWKAVNHTTFDGYYHLSAYSLTKANSLLKQKSNFTYQINSHNIQWGVLWTLEEISLK